MVITKQYLRELIKEELEKATLEEEQIEEVALKTAISAGVGILFGLLAAKGVPNDRAMAAANKNPQIVKKIEQKMAAGTLNQSGSILDDPQIAAEVDRIAAAQRGMKKLAMGVLPREEEAGMSTKIGGKK